MGMHRSSAARSVLQLAGLALLAAPAFGQLSSIYPVQALPVSGGDPLVAADFDADGRLDIVLGDAMLYVNRALPQGGYQVLSAASLGFDPNDMVASDVDGDGWLDVVACTYTTLSGTFGVVHGVGGGLLGAGTSYPTGKQAKALDAGDLDGDGWGDVVTTGLGSDPALFVSLADGLGGYLPAVPTIYAHDVDYVVLADIDADGALDAVFSSYTSPSGPSQIVVRAGDGAGGLGPAAAYPVATAPSRLIVGDLDVDGDLDVAVPCSGSQLSVGHGDGTGLLGDHQVVLTANNPSRIVAGDLDADGVPDLVTAHGNDNRITVLRGNGSGGYFPKQVLESIAQVGGVALTDATADGLVDVVAWGWGPGHLAVMAASGDHQLQSCERWSVDLPVAVAVGDLDANGHPDLVALGRTPSLSTRLADGAGGFLSAVKQTQLPPTNIAGLRDVALGDVTGDGAPDAVTLTQAWLAVAPNDGAGQLLPAATVAGSTGGEALGLADLDLDGQLDAVVADIEFQAPTGRLVRHLGQPTGLATPATWATYGDPRGLALGDVDDDGATDAVAVTSFGLSAQLNDGLGGLGQTVPTHNSNQGRDVALGDLNLDGHLDAVTRQENSPTQIYVLHGTGAGDFTLQTSWAPTPSSSDGEVAIADVDGDGWPDILDCQNTAPTVQVTRADGAGGWLPTLSFAAGLDPTTLVIADIDGDDRPDAIAGTDSTVSSSNEGNFAILRNQADFRWSDLGSALPGALGAPQLVGTGALTPGSPGDLRLFHARPLSLALLFISGTQTPTTFKGGTLVPLPPLAQLVVATDAAGSFVAGWPAWPFATPGQEWYFQYAIADPGAVHGVALSNALKAVEP
jgi:FG-GAP-like repeat